MSIRQFLRLSPDSPFRFFALPAELRYLVYETIVVITAAPGRYSRRHSARVNSNRIGTFCLRTRSRQNPASRYSRWLVESFLLTCKQIRSESIHLLFERNLFWLQRDHHRQLTQILYRLPINHFQSIRYLSIDISDARKYLISDNSWLTQIVRHQIQLLEIRHYKLFCQGPAEHMVVIERDQRKYFPTIQFFFFWLGLAFPEHKHFYYSTLPEIHRRLLHRGEFWALKQDTFWCRRKRNKVSMVQAPLGLFPCQHLRRGRPDMRFRLG